MAGGNPKSSRSRANRARGKRPVNSGPMGYQVVDAPANRTIRFRGDGPILSGRKVGTDYIAIANPPANTPDGSILFDLMITASLMPQLARFASSYQKIHWNSLEFQIASHAPTNITGGYIAGFIPDPADTLPAEAQRAKAKLVSTPNSIKTNIWDSSCLGVMAGNGRTASSCLPQRLLYTSESQDVREYSPGSFYLVTDGAISGGASISLSIKWDVSCKVESTEYDIAFQTPTEAAIQSTYAIPTRGTAEGSPPITINNSIGQAPLTWSQAFPSYSKPKIDVVIEPGDPLAIYANNATIIVKQWLYNAALDLFYAAYSTGLPILTAAGFSGSSLIPRGVLARIGIPGNIIQGTSTFKLKAESGATVTNVSRGVRFEPL